MAFDERDYMKNRHNDPNYNPKEFRGSKERYMKGSWQAESKKYKAARKYNNGEITWQTEAFGIPLSKLAMWIVLTATSLVLFNNGFFDRFLAKIRPSSTYAQQGYPPAPVNFNPQPVPTKAPLNQQSEISAPSITNTGAYSVPRSGNGHFYVPGSVNKSPAVFLVDTGASMTVISSSLAVRAGITQCTKREFMTAMGIDRDACVAKVARLEFGTFYMLNTEVGISKNLTGEALLGMSALKNLRMIQIGDKLLLENPN
ncbi:MAG TPA: TIGR02281 family clan AA aspartic protease [Arenimonas sp.]|nr:TIGR02281 family clan AA aspartic protease [Arenimonas sp.]